MKVLDIKAGKPYPAGALSNFARRPFVFRGIEIESMEGFVQGLKFESIDMQCEIFKKYGIGAKRAGKGKNWQQTQTLWFQGEPVERDSEEYQKLLDEAYEEMFKQNPKAQTALLDTQDATLKHSIGWHKANETVLTRQEFCSRLTKIREKLQVEAFIDMD